MKKIEKLAVKAVNTIIGIETYGWPPVCFGVIYQPPRPESRAIEVKTKKRTTKKNH